jgi:SAM-dependent methyltransferase
MSFQDYFSQQADEYVRYRPHYPEALFEYLSRLASNHSTAWDCGTGNGQAALGLVKYFDRVYATDASPQQIANALPHPRLDYFVCLAESTTFASSSLDLIAAAQSLHWFDAGRFFAEAKRVLKPEGILAIWCYGLFGIPEAPLALTTVLQDFYQEVAPFWRRLSSK